MLTWVIAALLALPQVNDGAIEVTVRNPDTRQEIPAVRVTVTLDPTQPTHPPSFAVSSFTDGKGLAEFESLVYGVYTVRVEGEGYSPGLGLSVFVRDSAPRQEIELHLSRALALSGRVLEADGTPRVNAHVVGLLLGYDNGRRALIRSTIPGGSETDTNERGEFRIAGLQPGEYYLRVQSGQSLAQNEGHDGQMFYHPGVVRTAEAIPIDLRDRDATGIEIRVPHTPAFKVSGTLVDPLQVAGGRERLYLVSAEPDNIDIAEALNLPNVGTETAGETSFEIRGVFPGAYYLYATRGTSLVNRTLVQVEDHDVKGLRLAFRPRPDVKGRIRVDGNTSTRGWNMAIAVTPNELLPPSLFNTTALSEAGRIVPNEFTLRSMIDDVRYTPVLSALPSDAYVADVLQGGISIFNNGGGIRSNAVDGPIEIVVGLQGGVIQGIARNAFGQGVDRAGAVLIPASPRRGTMQLYKEVQTDASGQFRFRGVAPGEYKVFVWSIMPRGRAYMNEGFLAPYESRGVSVRVSAGATFTVDASVIPTP